MLLRCALLFTLAAPALAGVIRVPADQPNLQAAIDVAAPGDVILVAQTVENPVVVDKPLTILGDPFFQITIECDFSGCPTCPEPDHAFRLAGPGSGTVVIGNVTASSFDCFEPAQAIGGGGFDELHVHDASFVLTAGLSGLGDGNAAIGADVPYILISRSTIKGSQPDSDHCSGFLLGDGYPAVDAPASTVVILDSKVTGGGDAHFCCVFCTCPGVFPPGGGGGPGVVANEVYVDDASTVQGGKGATYFAFPNDELSGGQVACTTLPDGPAFIATVVNQLGPGATGSGQVALGGTWSLSFDVPGPAAVLFFSGLSQPYPGGGFGFAFLDPVGLASLGPVPTGSPQTLAFPVPPAAVLLGIEGGFQILDATLGLTPPAVGVIGT